VAICRIILIIASVMFGINLWPDCGGSDIPVAGYNLTIQSI
jgi:hypothetical protein